jgi:hypothetical protein
MSFSPVSKLYQVAFEVIVNMANWREFFAIFTVWQFGAGINSLHQRRGRSKTMIQF